jgi:protease I
VITVAAQTDTRKVAFLVAPEGIERVELTEPWKAVKDAGFEPVLVCPKPGEVQTFDHLDKAETQAVDQTVADASVDEFAALVLPGGVANPDQLRTDEDAVGFARDFLASGKPLAAICHAPWTLVEAGVLDGRNLTSWPSLKTDISNAGGKWTDEKVVVDGNLITSRNPDDIPAFVSALLESLQHGVAADPEAAATAG